jgi:hydrogenase/urease accessory protein HupE
MAIFAPLSGLALFLTTTGWIKSVYPPVLICIALCAAVLLALEKTPPPVALGALFAAAALALGLDSGIEPAPTAKSVKTLLGNWISLSVLLADVAIYVSLAGEAKWLKIALRIAGSWIIAISLLVLAFSMRK